MDHSADQMDVDPPSFNTGRRRKFEEFAWGEQVPVDRVHQYRHMNPSAIQPPLHTDLPRQIHMQNQNGQRPLTWTQVLVQTAAISTVVIAILSAAMCRSLIRGATRAGRNLYVNRDYVRQRYTAVVQSSYNAAKRRLVTVSGNLPTLTQYRRHIAPSSSSSRRRSSHGIKRGRMRSEKERNTRELYLDSLRMEGIECTRPLTLPEVMDVESESSLSYMMRGALLGSPERCLHGSPYDTKFRKFEFESAVEVGHEEGSADENDGYESDGLDVTAHNVETDMAISSTSSYDESTTVDEEADTLSDTLSDTSEDERIYGGPPAYSFPEYRLSNPVYEELEKIHAIDTESICDTTELSSEFFMNQSPPPSDSSSQKPAVLSSSPLFAATPMRAGAQQNLSSSAIIPGSSGTKQSLKKSVAFFASPRTGGPITGTKKFVMGESMDFPVSSSPVSEDSTLRSMASSILPNNSLIRHERAIAMDRSFEHSDIHSGVDLYCDAAPELRHRDRLQASLLTVDTSGSPLRAGTSFTASASAGLEKLLSDTPTKEDISTPMGCNIFYSGNESGTGFADPPNENALSLVPGLGESLSTADEDVLLIDDADAVSREEVSAVATATSLAIETDRPAGSVKVVATEQSGRRSQSPWKSSSRNRRSLGTPQGLALSLEYLDLSSRRGSLRVAEKLLKEKRAREAFEAAEKSRREREAEEAARKAKEAEETARRKREAEAEEERRKQGVRRIPKEKIILPLDARWRASVQQALDTPNMRQVLVTLASGATLTRKDIGTLKVVLGRDPAHGWLNDEIIAACLQQVVDYGLKISHHKAGETPKYHAFNTFFYKNLRDKGAQSVKRWASRAKVGKENLLKVERVFIPVHQGAHWTLLVVSPLARTIEYFDSLGGHAGSYIQNAKLWLTEELGKEWKGEEWTVPTGSYGAGPRQTNGSDCGVFTCTTARMVVLGVDPMSYGGDDMELQRSRMVAELLNGGLKGDFEPKVVF